MRNTVLFFLLLGISTYPLRAQSSTGIGSVDINSSFPVYGYVEILDCKTDSSVFMELLGLTLHADSGSVIDAFTLSAERLPSTDAVAPMPSNMENVTAHGRAVYRLLPHGEHFAEPARLTMAYDPALLPHGYRPRDIYTFYYDSLNGRWMQLYRLSVDTVEHTVVSLTTHFTDFANAIIKVPEMPETKAFVPTMMQDLPDIDPLDQIPMIAVPEANNNGTAELTYPILIPQGRNGLQPSLALTYSSSNTGNGPLGVGWSLNMPAITVDTRWGVPRYDYIFETEAYTLNGQPLVMHTDQGQAIPLPHQSDHFEARTLQTRRFYYRDTRMQDKIIRHGQKPDEYWWSVTDRQGVTTYYGGIFDPNHPEDKGLDTTAVLRDRYGNIGYWAISAVIDLYGNYIRYTYFKDGNNLYPNSIEYTGNYKEPLLPAYSVDFEWRNRTDVTSEARLGFMRRTNKMLCHLRCVYDNVPFRIYAMRYQDPEQATMFKSRLVEVMQIDSCTHHLIEYYGITYGCINLDELYAKPWPGTRTLFSYEDAPPSSELFATQPVNYTGGYNQISMSRTTSWDIGGTVSVGLGFVVPLTTLSIGGNYTYSRGDGQSDFMLIDLNGDGLPDQVYEENGQIKYRRQLQSHSFADTIPILGLSRLSHEVSKTRDWGVQADILAANVSAGWPVTDSYTDTYFSDVNGDGLPDMVTPEGIRFNHLLYDSIPSFDNLLDTRTSAQSNATIPVANSVCGEITLNGEVNDHLLCRVSSYVKHQYDYNSIMPIDHDESVWSAESFNGGVLTDSTLLHALQDDPELFVEATGDGVFIRYPSYQSCNRERVDPNIEVVRVWVAPQNGTLSISGSVHMESDTSYSHQQARHADGVICYIQKSTNVTFSGRKIASSGNTVLTQLTLNDNDTLPQALNTNTTVQKGDVLLFRIFSRNNSDYDRVRWQQQINYTSSGYQSYNSATDYVCVGENDFVAPYEGSVRATVICNNEGNTSDTIHLRYYHASTCVDTICIVPANTTDTLKFHRSAIAKYDTISVWQVGGVNTVWSNVHTYFSVDYASDSICEGERTMTYTPDIHIHGISQNSPYASSTPPANPGYPIDKYRTLFGGTLYRGWGHFAYNWTDIPNPNFSIIPLAGLYNTTDSTLAVIHADTTAYKQNMQQSIQGMDASHIQNFTADSLKNRIAQNGLYNPLLSGAWVEMNADSRTERYIAYGQLGYLGQYIQSNTRVTDNPLVFRDTLYDSVPSQPDIITYDSPFPKVSGNGRLITIRKSSRTKQERLSAGVGFGPLGMAFSDSKSTQTVESDYTDLNGDGFPDFIGLVNGIQYSTPWGGIGRIQETDLSPYVCTSSSTGNNFSGHQGGEPEKIAGNGQTSGRFTIKACPGSVGISQGHNQGYSETKKTYVDINGDGLPDKVDIDSNTVAYNIGYSFLNPIPFDSLIAVNEGSCWGVSGGENFGGGIQFVNNLIENGLIDIEDLSQLTKVRFAEAQASISLGVNLSVSDDYTDRRLFDMNGDGLPDLVSLYGNNTIKVSYNTGGHFTAPQTVNLSALMKNHSDNVGINLGLTGGITIFGIVKFCLGVQSTPWSMSASQTTGDLIDMNGDGYPDWVEATANGLRVRFHQGARTNLLTSVTNTTGQKIKLDYTLSDPDVHHRQRQWNLTQVTDSDRLNPNPDLQSIRTTIQYLSPHYDSYERTDYGYKTVITQIGDKRLTQHFQNESYMLHGEKTEDLLSDTLNSPYIGHRYSRGFFLGGDPSQTLDTVASALCQDADIHIHHNGDWTDWYEGHSNPQLSMLTQSFYDSLYNLTRFVHHGNYALPGDEWTQDITYSTSAIHRGHHLISLPMRERVCGGGQTLRLSDAEYNHYGSIERIDMYDTASGVILTTELTYDSLGHPIRAVYPTGMQLDITYDTDVQTYPASVSNSFNETTLTDYDMRWGRPIRTTDPANNVIYYDYDVSGRLVSVLAPFESVAGLNHTVEYLYHNRGHRLNHSYQETDSFTHVTKVMHSVYSLQPDTELVIFDARGKELQRKRLMTVGSSKKWISGGHTIFDQFYRPIQQYYPCQIGGTILIQDYDPTISSTCTIPTITTYDILDRTLSTEYPDHATEYMAYDVEDNALHTIHTDANSNRQDIYKSPQDWTLRTREGTDSMTIYQYNPIGELVRVTDAEGYRTDYTYDMFGHTTSRTHPDNGVTRWQYGNAGLLESMQTQRLYDKNAAITYTYDHGRLTDISTPSSASIHYDYNSSGRVSKRWDASGTEEFTYDALGNVSRSVRRLAVPTEADVYVFQTDYLYDSYGRMQRITYPDGEQVNYHYGTGGMLSDMESNYYGTICEREYDERGNRVYQYFGNGTKTNYFYSTTRNWLSRFESNNGSGMFSSKHYTFDPVGNVASTSINEGASPAFASWNTGYLYDNRNRLVQTHDAYDYGVMYSPTNKIWHKAYTTALPGSITTQFNLIYGYDADTITHQPRVIYDDYSASSLALFWDADGNLAQMVDCDRNRMRFHRWNDFDRLTLSLGHDFCGYYGYDADGIRTYKLMGTCNISTQNGGGLQAQAIFDDMVLYPSPYMVVTPRGYTNHYYAGSERIASRVGNRCWSITPTDDWEKPAPETEAREAFWNIGKENPFGTMSDYSSTTINTTFDAGYIGNVQYKCGAVELPSVDILYGTNMLETTIDCDVSYQNSAPIYYYHPDHLGSTSWVTDESGNEQQFLAYLPYGEPLMDVHLKTYDGRHGPDDIRYKFTGKERDAETGYDYMEQRYYYPPLSIWLRPDPLLDKYIQSSPYAYCNGNPLIFVDPNGESYAINTNGHVDFIDDGQDAHVILNANNSRYRVEFDLTKGKILGLLPIEDVDGINLLEMENMEVAEELYVYMAQNMDMLEFNVISASSEDEKCFYVGNSQESHKSKVGNYVFFKLGQTINKMKHFHPTNPNVSNKDKENAANYYRNKEQYPQANPEAELSITYRDENGKVCDVPY